MALAHAMPGAPLGAVGAFVCVHAPVPLTGRVHITRDVVELWEIISSPLPFHWHIDAPPLWLLAALSVFKSFFYFTQSGSFYAVSFTKLLVDDFLN
jgi:hypothetical protein